MIRSFRIRTASEAESSKDWWAVVSGGSARDRDGRIVEANHDHVLRYPAAGFPQDCHRLYRHQIGGHEEAVHRGLALQQLPGGYPAGGW